MCYDENSLPRFIYRIGGSQVASPHPFIRFYYALKEVIPVTYPVDDGTFTSTKRQEVINAGTAGLKLTDQQVRQLQEAVNGGDTEAATALAKRGK